MSQTVKVVFVNKTLIAVLRGNTEPISWLTRHDFVLMGDVQFGAGLTKVPVRSIHETHTQLAEIAVMDLED